MNFRDEIKSLHRRQGSNPLTEDELHDLFERHVKSWHDGDAEGYIWQYLGITLEQYSEIIMNGDGLMTFFEKIRQEEAA